MLKLTAKQTGTKEIVRDGKTYIVKVYATPQVTNHKRRYTKEKVNAVDNIIQLLITPSGSKRSA